MDELSLYFSTDNECTNEAHKETTNDLKAVYSGNKTYHSNSKQCKIGERPHRRSRKSRGKSRQTSVSLQNYALTHEQIHSLEYSNIDILPNILPPETEEGNVEYKRKLVNPTPDRFEHLVTQMQWRLNEGDGRAIYRLGVDDDGHVYGLSPNELNSSLSTLERMAKCLNATLHPLRERMIESPTLKSAGHRKAVEVLVWQYLTSNNGNPDMCLAVVGGMDAGKSTLIGILTSGELDNGHGKARLNLFRHLHEVQSGRTSSLSSELLGFDSVGNVTNYTKNSNGRIRRHSIDEIIHSSTNLITLFDLAGHVKYQRTTLCGISFGQPVGALLVISATTCINTISLEHLHLICALNLPFIIVLTKIDRLSSTNQCKSIDAIYHNIVYHFQQIAKNTQLLNSVHQLQRSDTMGNVVHAPPIFPVSNVTGQGVDDLLRFLSCLNSNDPLNNKLSLSSSSTTLDPLVDRPQEKNDSLHETTQYNIIALKQLDQLNAINEQIQQCMMKSRYSQKMSHQLHFYCSDMKREDSLFWITQIFTRIPGVTDVVVFGRVQIGKVNTNQVLWLGPNQFGEFQLVRIITLMYNHQSHNTVYAGQFASMALRFVPQTSTTNYPTNVPTLANSTLTSLSSFTCIDKSQSYCPSTNTDDLSFEPVQTMMIDKPRFKIKRGMVLITDIVCFNLSRELDWPQPTLSTTPLSSISASNHIPNFAVAWTLRILIHHVLPNFTLKHNTVIFHQVERPNIGQHIRLYSGCVYQMAIVLDYFIEASEASGINEQNFADNYQYITVRFTKQPEFIELGRPTILTWNGNRKLVGHVADLFDPVSFIPESTNQSNRSHSFKKPITPNSLNLSCVDSVSNRLDCDSPCLSTLTDPGSLDRSINLDQQFGSIDCLHPTNTTAVTTTSNNNFFTTTTTTDNLQ